MKWLRGLMGTDFPDPVAGQVWRSENSGKHMRVHRVETHDSGSVFVYVQYERVVDDAHPYGWRIATHYCIDFDEWRCRLREERRSLVSFECESALPDGRPIPPPSRLVREDTSVPKPAPPPPVQPRPHGVRIEMGEI